MKPFAGSKPPPGTSVDARFLLEIAEIGELLAELVDTTDGGPAGIRSFVDFISSKAYIEDVRGGGARRTSEPRRGRGEGVKVLGGAMDDVGAGEGEEAGFETSLERGGGNSSDSDSSSDSSEDVESTEDETLEVAPIILTVGCSFRNLDWGLGGWIVDCDEVCA